MKIIIDNREKKLIPFFENIETKNLDIGDIQFKKDDKITLVIERKTQEDLSASIKDGRHREQKLRLLNCNIPIIIYIIEGKCTDKYINGITSDTQISSILNTVFRDKFYLFRTLNIDETSVLIKKLYQKMEKDEFKIKDSDYSSVIKDSDYSSVIKVKKKDNLTPEICYIAQLSQIPGVSNTIAKCIIETYPSMFSLCEKFNNTTINERKKVLENLTFNQTTGKSRKVGKVISERIYNYIIN